MLRCIITRSKSHKENGRFVWNVWIPPELDGPQSQGGVAWCYTRREARNLAWDRQRDWLMKRRPHCILTP
jgi:hypothetical protein